MAVATFDTLKYSNALKAAGVPEKQADAQSLALEDAFKNNLRNVVSQEELRSSIAEFRIETKASLDQMRFEMKTGFDMMRAEIKAGFDLMRQEMKNQVDQLRHEMKESEQRTNAKIDLVDARLSAKIDNLKLELGYVKWLVYVALFGFIMAFIRSLLFKTAVF